MIDPAIAAALCKQAMEGPDPYTGRAPIPSGVGPGTEQFLKEQKYERPLERNVVVGPLLVSACRCPQCGQIYAHAQLFGGGYGAAMTDDEPDPPCWRCEVSVDVPLSPTEAAAMAEVRWKYDRYLAANDGPTGVSQAERRATFLAMCTSAQIYAPVLLAALERRYGNQQDAGVAAIENGTAGVVEERSGAAD